MAEPKLSSYGLEFQKMSCVKKVEPKPSSYGLGFQENYCLKNIYENLKTIYLNYYWKF